MSSIYTMEPSEMRGLLINIKAMVDSNGRPADVVDDIRDMLSNEKPLKYDPYPFPDEAQDPKQLKLII